MNAILTVKSKNEKTGTMPVSITEMKSCPPNCRQRKVCYAGGSGLGCVWRLMSSVGTVNTRPWSEFCQAVAALPPSVKIWRHNQAGDLVGHNGRLNLRACLMLANANCADGYNRGGFTYTHYSPVAGRGVSNAVAQHNLKVVIEMNKRGFTVNLSADNLVHADQLADLNAAPVVTVLPMNTLKGTRTPAGRVVAICPAVTSKHGVQCRDCLLCQKAKRRVIVGFPAHGYARHKASAMASANDSF